MNGPYRAEHFTACHSRGHRRGTGHAGAPAVAPGW